MLTITVYASQDLNSLLINICNTGINIPVSACVISVAALLDEGFAVYALGNCRIGFVSSDLDGFECAVVFIVHIELAGGYVAMDTWILRHDRKSPFV